MRRWCSAGSTPSISSAAISKIEPSLSAQAISEAHRQAARVCRRAGRTRHPEDRQQQHGAGDQCQFGRQGRRPAQLLADGLRRRRAAAFGVACRGDLARKDVDLPVHPGITAATGLLVTDLQYEYTHSTLLVLDKAGEAEFARANAVLDDLIGRANHQLDADGIPAEQRRFRQIAECRYVGQGFELRAEMPDGQLDRASVGRRSSRISTAPTSRSMATPSATSPARSSRCASWRRSRSRR